MHHFGAADGHDAGGYTDPDGSLTNVLVRRAINHALNTEEMAEYLIGAWGSGDTAETAAIARIQFADRPDRTMSGDAALAESVLSSKQTTRKLIPMQLENRRRSQLGTNVLVPWELSIVT